MSKQTASNVRSPRGREATLEDEAERHRAEVRVNLEQSRATFHSLLGSLKEADLPVRRPGSAWSVREVATHVVTSIENNPVLIGALRRGHDHLNLPVWVAEPVKRIYTWRAARGATRETLTRRFDAAYAPVLALVDGIRADEWDKGGQAYGEGFWTVEYAFRHQLEHVEEHMQQIRWLIERS